MGDETTQFKCPQDGHVYWGRVDEVRHQKSLYGMMTFEIDSAEMCPSCGEFHTRVVEAPTRIRESRGSQ